jgi:SAM-dependent methyltransferase
MKKIYLPMIRYGDKEFDEGFVGWGFLSAEESQRDAQAVLDITSLPGLKILDLACGLGTYHRVWTDAGHTVVGTDLSETFIQMAQNNNPEVTYRVEDYYELNERSEYDLVTMMDTPVDDEDIPRNAYTALKCGGSFIFQISNPDYLRLRGQKLENYRSWQENDDRTFLLTRHEYNENLDRWEYEEWNIDMVTGEILVQHNFSTHLPFSRIVDILLAAGFCSVAFVDANGRPHGTSKEAPRSFFCIAHKGAKQASII